eukprot:TRINITY_DN4833_c0_g1_i5.p1 TRINITY_DN4833_c0_g1~~TRINITY_DN4833_c0_g1_i5.p1  ORF type:complete len:228 (-),score=39.28 TRINITY_DN4833_c0_g1_i5:61-744(-)
MCIRDRYMGRVIIPEAEGEEDVLSFYIKRYDNPKSFTTFLFEAAEAGKVNFALSGPHGEGLELEDTLHDKKLSIYVAGTGILPFLDFFAEATEYLIHKTLGSKRPEAAKSWNLHKGPSVLEGANITFFASFSSEEEFLGRSIIQSLAKLSAAHEPRFFQAYVRISDGTKIEGVENFNEHLSTSQLAPFTSAMYGRHIICGPTKFNRDVARILGTLEVPEQLLSLIHI